MEYPVYMKYLTLLVLVGFIAVGAFGFMGMSHDMGHGSGGCVASIVNTNALCPSDTILSALYHVSAYKSFTEAAFGAGSIITLLAALLLLLAASLIPRPIPAPIPSTRRRDLRREPRVFHAGFIHWLSLFENSPSRR